MIIAQFTNTYVVDNHWKHTFMYYESNANLHRLGSDPDIRPSGYKNLLRNQDQDNKNQFRLIFTME